MRTFGACGEGANAPRAPPLVTGLDYNKNMGAVDRHDQLVRNYAIDRKSRRWWVRMFVNFLDAIMVNAYIIYKENFRIMNMPAPVKRPKPLAHDKFMSGVIHKSAWPTTSTAPHSFSWKRAWFCQPRWVGASQVWQMPPLLHRCKRRKAQRNWIWLQNLCKAFVSFWLPWTIPQAEQYLLNIAANYILYKMQEFFYFPHKFVMFYGSLSGDKG